MARVTGKARTVKEIEKKMNGKKVTDQNDYGIVANYPDFVGIIQILAA